MACNVCNSGCVHCPHDGCKICILRKNKWGDTICVPCSWKSIEAKGYETHVLFVFPNTSNNIREHFILLHSEIYLVHLWDMDDIHGLTALRRAGISTLADLVGISDSRLLNVRGFGEKSLREVIRIQEKYLNRKVAHQLTFDLE